MRKVVGAAKPAFIATELGSRANYDFPSGELVEPRTNWVAISLNRTTANPSLRRNLCHWIVRVRRPVGIVWLNRCFGARIDSREHRHHIDAVLYRADIHTQITSNTLFINDFEV